MLVLRKGPGRGPEAGGRPWGLHLRSVHRALQRNHPWRSTDQTRYKRGRALGPRHPGEWSTQQPSISMVWTPLQPGGDAPRL